MKTYLRVTHHQFSGKAKPRLTALTIRRVGSFRCQMRAVVSLVALMRWPPTVTTTAAATAATAITAVASAAAIAASASN